jgi:hypothetical protein
MAPAPTNAPALVRPGSRSSTRTVTAHDDADCTPAGASRVASAGMSDGLFGSSTDPHANALDAQDVYVRDSVRRRAEEVREAIRGALRDALEEYAGAGDVQTCAMMALVASTELRMGQQRALSFVEAYIGTWSCGSIPLRGRVFDICVCRPAGADEAAHYRCVSAETFSFARDTLRDQRKGPLLKTTFPLTRILFFIFSLRLSFKRQSICLAAGAESLSLLNKVVPCARIADHLQPNAQFGSFV